jgi:type I restriction enzyme M protein
MPEKGASEQKAANHESVFMRNIQRAVEKGYFALSAENSKITYHCSRDYTTSFKKPEEKVRASYFAELVLDYEYPSKKIDIEVIVPRRKPEDRADIVIYEDDELKKPYLVVECKKDGITDAEFKQAIEQAFGNANSLRAKFAAVIAGTTKTVFDVAGFNPSERERNVISDVSVRYGKTPKYRFLKGDPARDLKIVSREELIRALEKSHDTVWQGGRLAPTTAFDEVSKLLFCKLKDEKGTKKGDTYKFQIGTHESAEEVFDRIDSIYQKAKKEDSEVFREDIRLDAKIVYNVVEHLQELAINKIDLDTKGVAFERFMQDFFKGKMGQFFTPRPIVEFAVKMLNPERTDLVLDPACGSGGFLLNAMDLVKKFVEENYDEKEARDHWHNFAMNNLYGIEINDQIARVCKMNMIIHDDGHTNVISTDSLRDVKEITDIHPKFKKDYFDIILTNPPFGATVKSTEKDYLEKYDLGKGKKNQKTEIMFIERCIEFVKPKTGRIGIVLPDGILTNSSLQYVRNFIMEKCQILAVVSLPQFAFTHYGAGVKSSLVFLRRKGENEKSVKYPIFMAIAEHIGYDATGREVSENDFNTIYTEYKKFLKGK